MDAVPHLQEVRVGADAADRHFPGDRRRNLEDEIEIERGDEPRGLGQFRVELPSLPARVAREHKRATGRRISRTMGWSSE